MAVPTRALTRSTRTCCYFALLVGVVLLEHQASVFSLVPATNVQARLSRASLRGPRDISRAAAGPTIFDANIGDVVKGKVTQLNQLSADVDMGLPFHGNIHVAELGKGKDVNIEDVLKIGDEVTLRVKDISYTQLHLSRVDNPLFEKKPLSDFSPGDVVDGKLLRTGEFHSYFDVGAMRDAVVLTSKLGDISVGDVVELRAVVVTNKMLEFSIE